MFCGYHYSQHTLTFDPTGLVDDTTEIKLSDEHIDYSWSSLEDAVNNAVFENARDLYEAVNKHILR